MTNSSFPSLLFKFKGLEKNTLIILKPCSIYRAGFCIYIYRLYVLASNYFKSLVINIKKPQKGAFLVQVSFLKNISKKGQYFLNVSAQPITFATPR